MSITVPAAAAWIDGATQRASGRDFPSAERPGRTAPLSVTRHDSHVQSGGPLHADFTAFLLALGADPLRPCNGMTVIAEAETCGHWLAAQIMQAWINRGSTGRDHEQGQE